MNRVYFENKTTFYDGMPIATIGADIVYLRDMMQEGGLVSATVKDAAGHQVTLSREYLQAGIVATTVTLLAGFAAGDVAELATEAELNAQGFEGRWNLAAEPPAADLVATHLERFPSGNFIGSISTNDLMAVSALTTLSTAIAAKRQERQVQKGFGEKVLDFLGL